LVNWSVEPITTPDCPDPTPLAHRVRVGDHVTTLYVEAATWIALCRIAREQDLTIDQLCTEIAEVTAPDASFAQAARCYVFDHIAGQIPDRLLPPELLNLRRHGYRRSIQ
jgi:predicted DNA-binding ribbon-helix-helix protein